jgi:hypothetical protein
MMEDMRMQLEEEVGCKSRKIGWRVSVGPAVREKRIGTRCICVAFQMK